jgi:hypothetical protein
MTEKDNGKIIQFREVESDTDPFDRVSDEVLAYTFREFLKVQAEVAAEKAQREENNMVRGENVIDFKPKE